MSKETTSHTTAQVEAAEKPKARREKLSYGVQMEIVRRRMWASPTEIAKAMKLSTGAVINCLTRNKDVLERFRKEVQEQALQAAIADAVARQASTPAQEGV